MKTSSASILCFALLLPVLKGQYGPVGHNVPTTPAQQTAINQAVQFLEWTGEDLTGISVSAADLAGRAPAAASGDGTNIGIDFDRIEEVVPPNTPGAPGHPGLLVILIYHELQHIRYGWGRDDCQEAEMSVYIATKHCEFICFVQAGGGEVAALCKLYEHVRGVINDPLMRAHLASLGCSGNTGPIPACECCAGN